MKIIIGSVWNKDFFLNFYEAWKIENATLLYEMNKKNVSEMTPDISMHTEENIFWNNQLLQLSH